MDTAAAECLPTKRSEKPLLETTAHLGAIDALRGLAALYVVAFHLLFIPTTKVAAPAFASSFLHAGHSGVTLFFVISAFTLCLSSDRRSDEKRPLLRFYLRRFFRIVPLFLVLLVITLARSWYLYGVLPNPFFLGANLTFLYNFIPGHQEGIVWASWTLGVEMVFYAFFPFIFRYVNSLRRAIGFFVLSVAVALVVGAATHYRPDFFKFSLFRHLPAFATGFIAHYLFKEYRTYFSVRVASILILAACTSHLLLAYSTAADVGQLVPLQALIWAMLALGLCAVPSRFFVNPATIAAGAISYSIYLVHPLILFALSPAIPLLAFTGSWHYAACLLLAVISVTTVALVTYRLIEQPGIRTGSRLIRQYCH